MPHVIKAKKHQTGEKQCQQHDHHFLWLQGDCAQRICPIRPNYEFRVLPRVLRRLRDNVRRRRPKLWREQTWHLQRDNAPSHSSILTHQFLAKNKMAVIPHTPYSPDLAPCGFFLFAKMKLKLKGRRFDTTEETKAKWWRVLDTLTIKDFQEAFQKWRSRWDRCLHAAGNYFEGDGGR